MKSVKHQIFYDMKITSRIQKSKKILFFVKNKVEKEIGIHFGFN